MYIHVRNQATEYWKKRYHCHIWVAILWTLWERLHYHSCVVFRSQQGELKWICSQRLSQVANWSRLNEINAPPSTMPQILKLSTEIRLRIYDFCFPGSNRQVQLILYYLHDIRYQLNLPLEIYLVYKEFYHELPPRQVNIRSLDFIFLTFAKMHGWLTLAS